jgi:hypothetical protein
MPVFQEDGLEKPKALMHMLGFCSTLSLLCKTLFLLLQEDYLPQTIGNRCTQSTIAGGPSSLT